MAVLAYTVGPGPIGFDPIGPSGPQYPWDPGPGPQWPVDPTNPLNLPIPIGANICRPDQRCIGLSGSAGGVGFCLGTCVAAGPNQPPIPQPDPSTPIVPPSPTQPTTPGVCDLPTRLFCEGTCGTKTGNGGNGKCCSSNASCCTLPNGRPGKTNKTRYYRFGDCRRGTSAGVVEPGTVCVKPRRKNYGNIKALRGAINRATGFDRIVKRNRKALRKLATL